MFIRQLFEKISRTGEGDTAVIGWGRGMGHKGHMMLASSVITQAKKVNGDPYFVVSRTVGKDDPLTADEKIAIYKKVFPKQGHIFQAASDELPDLTKVLANLNKQGYRNATVVLGDEESKAFQFLKQYNGKPNKKGEIIYSFDNLDVIGRSATGDPSAGEEGPRATPLRNILNDPNVSPEEQFKVWRDAMSPEVSDDEVRALMAKAKERMAQFSAPKTTKKSGVAEGITEAPIDMDPQDPMNPMIYGTGANPGTLKYRMLRATKQLQDLASRAENASASEWDTISKQFQELKMNVDQIRHGLDELKKLRSKGGVRSRGIENF